MQRGKAITSVQTRIENDIFRVPVGEKRLLKGLGRRMPYPHDLPEDLEHGE